MVKDLKVNVDEIKADYGDSLILGNGASIAIDSKFNYSSLSNNFSPELESIFKRFLHGDYGRAELLRLFRHYDQ